MKWRKGRRDPKAANMTNVTDALNHVSSYTYDEMNRQVLQIRPDSSIVTNSYDALGWLVAKTGAGGVPEFYAYDALGRMTNLVDGEGHPTAFAYDALGRLTRKTCADGSFYACAYNARGWLTNRVDALGKATRYAHNNAGQLMLVDYATDVDVTSSYDNLGRQTSRVDAAGNWTWTYDDESARILCETLAASSATSTVQYSYASNTFDLASVSYGGNTTLYSWVSGRLNAVSAVNRQSAIGNWQYSYVPNSDLLAQMTNDQGLATLRTYDAADRLTNISSYVPSVPFVANSFSYTLDAVGRRTARQDADGTRTDWGYDALDQLVLAGRTNGPNGAADAAYRYEYQYDEVGNRLRELRGPQNDSKGRQLELRGSFNELNQLTAQAWAGKMDIVGSVNTADSVILVQGLTNAPPFWNSTNWLGGASVQPGSNRIAIVAWEGTNATATNWTVWLPPSNPRAFGYDLNGNLTNDGRRVYTWDLENRLVAVETRPGVGPESERRRSEYVYDAHWRRIARTDCSGWNGSAYTATNVTRFVWDGWLLLAEMAGSAGVPPASTNFCVWGQDLSGTLQGAGGIGGLLCNLEFGISNSSVFYTHDGNGNVTDVLDTNNTVIAHYEYDPFGRTVAQSGSYADANPWRFSTKQFDAWGLYYYGYRYYDPLTGRWLSRDPIGERGGVGLYAFVGNRPADKRDFLGLSSANTCCRVSGNVSSTPLRRKCCIATFDIPSERTGQQVIGPLAQQDGGQFYRVQEGFKMNATFKDGFDNSGALCCPECCEYRQYIKGYIKKNGVSQGFDLGPGRPLSESTYQEDGDGTHRYGHRSDPEMATDVYSDPDRKWGKRYAGIDIPGLPVFSGETLDLRFDFRGSIIDVCQKNSVVRSSDWTVPLVYP